MTIAGVSADTNIKVDAFEKGQPKLAVTIPGNTSRTAITRTIEERVKNSSLINQNVQSLYGPAAFMHCFVNDHPDEYVNYLLDIIIDGEGHLGAMGIKPKEACLSETRYSSVANRYYNNQNSSNSIAESFVD